MRKDIRVDNGHKLHFDVFYLLSEYFGFIPVRGIETEMLKAGTPDEHLFAWAENDDLSIAVIVRKKRKGVKK